MFAFAGRGHCDVADGVCLGTCLDHWMFACLGHCAVADDVCLLTCLDHCVAKGGLGTAVFAIVFQLMVFASELALITWCLPASAIVL